MFVEQFGIASVRGWDTIYVAVDWHGTISPSTYSKDLSKISFYSGAIGALKKLSSHPKVKLILYTSSSETSCEWLIEYLRFHGVVFSYVNCNPEVKNTDTGNFDSKFYFNILLDDKAGFDPTDDWYEITKIMNLFEGNIQIK